MLVQSKIAIVEINNVLANYAIGKAHYINEITSGFANTNFKISTQSGNYLMRFCNEQSLEMVKYEIDLMDTLRKKSFPTAYPILGTNGSFITQTENGNVVIYEFKEGEEPEQNHETVNEIATAIGTLNAIPEWKNHLKQNVVNIDDCLYLIDNFGKQPCQYPAIYKDFEALVHDLTDSLKVELPKGIIHADLFPDNTLFIGNKLNAIVDFEEANVDHLMFDVGMTINGFCFVNNQLNPGLFRTFIKKYNEIRSLNETEEELLKTYIVWGAVGMAYWHLRHLTQRAYNKQELRVRELLNRAANVNRTIKNDQLKSLIKN